MSVDAITQRRTLKADPPLGLDLRVDISSASHTERSCLNSPGIFASRQRRAIRPSMYSLTLRCKEHNVDVLALCVVVVRLRVLVLLRVLLLVLLGFLH